MRASEQASWTKHIDFTVIDLLALAGSFVLAYWLKFDNFGFVNSPHWKSLLVMLLLADVAVTLLTSPYSGVLRRSYWEDIGAYLKLALFNFLIATVIFYLFKIGSGFSREMVITTFVTYPVSSIVLKAIWKKGLLSRGVKRPSDSMLRLVLVGSSDTVEATEQLVHAEDMQVSEVVGYCLIDGSQEATINGRPATNPAGLEQLASAVIADEVLVTVNPTLVDDEVYEQLIENGVRVRFAIQEALGVDSEIQTIGRVGVMKTLDLDRYSFGTGRMLYLPVKRLIDMCFGVVGCLFILPIALVVKIAYLANGDTKSVFYTQRRVGQGGREFGLYKFRSMVWNADEVLKELLKDPELRKQWEADQKLEDDPRITKVGRILRKTSLDEVPQFLNVLIGDMSVIGPRPLVPGELEEHGGRMLYNRVKPGITGWWACNGRSNIGYRERLELEYHYVKHCSPYLDALCVVRTVAAVLKRDGAV